MILDPEKVLARADELVAQRDRFAALPSTDVQLRAIAESLCAELNAVLEIEAPSAPTETA